MPLTDELKVICEKLLVISDEICSLEGDMSDEVQKVCLFFCIRQTNHMRNLIKIFNQNDVMLIARSMLEGVIYQLAMLPDKKNTLMEQWQLFPCVMDIKNMDRGDDMQPQDELTVEFYKKNRLRIEELFKKNNGEWYRKWTTKQTIRELAYIAGEPLLKWYDIFYAELSEYHHWDSTWFAKNYQVRGQTITKVEDGSLESEAKFISIAVAMQAICLSANAYLLSIGRKDSEYFNELEELGNESNKIFERGGMKLKEVNVTTR